MLVAFEGIDGSGKSSVLPLVAKRLRKAHRAKVMVTSEPTDTWLGRTVRVALRRQTDPLTMAGLFLADRALHVAQLYPHRRHEEIVLTDRYVDSTTAYQAAALEGTLPTALTTLQGVQRMMFPHPDLVVLLDLPPKTALRRIKDRQVKEVYERERFLAKVRKNYLALAKQDPRRWVVLDATRPKATVVTQALKAIEARL